MPYNRLYAPRGLINAGLMLMLCYRFFLLMILSHLDLILVFLCYYCSYSYSCFWASLSGLFFGFCFYYTIYIVVVLLLILFLLCSWATASEEIPIITIWIGKKALRGTLSRGFHRCIYFPIPTCDHQLHHQYDHHIYSDRFVGMARAALKISLFYRFVLKIFFRFFKKISKKCVRSLAHHLRMVKSQDNTHWTTFWYY